MPDVPAVPLALVVVLAVALATVAVLFTARRLVLARTLWSFDCSLRRPGATGWTIGVARYGPGHLDWFRIFSLSPRPTTVWPQAGLTVLGRRPVEGGEVFAVLPGALVVRCLAAGEEIELAISMDAYVGLASWLEGAPPGQQGKVT